MSREMATQLIARVPLIKSDFSDLGKLQLAGRPQRTHRSVNYSFVGVLKIAEGPAQRLLANLGVTVRTARRQLNLTDTNFSLKLTEQIQRVEILIAFHRQNLPPVQTHAIEKPASAPLKHPVHPTIAFRLPRELVNAQDLALQRPTPVGISF